VLRVEHGRQDISFPAEALGLAAVAKPVIFGGS